MGIGRELEAKLHRVYTQNLNSFKHLFISSAHPNLKLFITHGGLMGTLEAVNRGVPMIMIPLFGDQFRNSAAVSEKGAAIVLDYFELTESKLAQAIDKILNDKR